MRDVYLRAATEADLKVALPWALAPDGSWNSGTDKWALVVIGEITAVPAVFDANMVEVSPAIKADGWHANLRLLDEALFALLPPDILITVTSPSTIWA